MTAIPRRQGRPLIPPLPMAALVATLSACGASQSTEPEHPDTSADDAARHQSAMDEIGTSAEIGALPVAETEYAFKQAFKTIARCFEKNRSELEFIGGEISLKVLVGGDGQVRSAFAERSTLGHNKTEKCMFDALRAQDWPKPVGGQTGVAQTAFVFDPSDEVRPPVPWSEGEIKGALGEHRAALSECKGNAHGVVATLYVDQNGSVLGVGVAGDDEQIEDARDCLVRVLSAATYPSPGSWPAKVSVQL